MDRKIVVDEAITPQPAKQSMDFSDVIRVPAQFRALSRLVLRDLNNTAANKAPSFYLYSKEKIQEFLKNPYKNQKQLRDAAIYLYGASSHFRRLINYFAGLSDLSFVVSPYRIDPNSAKPTTVNKQYRKTLNLLSSMDIKNQFNKILTVCLREDVFYGTLWVTNDSVTVQQLPSDYCELAVIEGNVLNVSFNFSYFDANPAYLELYSDEFKKKYELYKNDRVKMKWQELDAPYSFAVKCNNDILAYALPPFVGIFREVYDLEDYKQLRMTKTELENYALLAMKLGINDDGEWEMDLDKAKEFWRNLDAVLPEAVGSVLTPMQIDKISFERSEPGNTNIIADAEQNLFTAAGVSTLLFNNDKASSNALLLSIKADQAITFGIVKSIEGVVNRFVQSYSYGKNFKVTFLDCSRFNRNELGDQYLKACQYGLPFISMYAASQGLGQADMDCMNFLENDVLGLIDRFRPLRSSNTLSSKDAGAPQKNADDLTDSGESSREHEDGDNDME